MACIYKITNLVNGKVYIGKTSLKTCNNRWKYYRNIIGKPYAPNTAIINALNKYGYDNFKFECIEKDIKIEDINEREQFWVSYYNTYVNGYNETVGGDGKQFLTDDLKKSIIEYYLINKTITKVAEKFRIDPQTVSNLLDIYGIHKFTQWEQKHNRLESEIVPSIIELYNQGHSINYIHKELNLSNNFITRILKEHGLDTNTKRKIKDRQQLLELYESNGCNAKKTAEQLGVTITTVSNNLKDFGINTNHRINKE